MRRILALVLVAVIAFAGCGSDATAEPGPAERASAWLAAVAAGDGDALAGLVDERTLIVVLAVENSLSTAEAVALFREGLSIELRASYWESFRAAFGLFAPADLAQLAAGAVSDLEVSGRAFAAVEVVAPDGAATELVLQESDGAWLVDMVATMGPVMVRPLRSYSAGLGTGEDAAAVRAEFSAIIPVSLTAALSVGERGDLPEDFRSEAIRLIDELGGL